MAEHKDMVHDTTQTIHNCDLCKKTFENIIALDNHRNSVHKMKIKEVGDKTTPKCKCDLCQKTFDNLTDFQRHYKLKHGMHRQTQCDICKVEFSHTYKLTSHLQQGHGKHDCNYCNQFFLKKCGLKIHIGKHHVETSKQIDSKYQCDLCTAQFLKPDEIQGHYKNLHFMSTQSGCKICGKLLKSDGGLKNHLKRFWQCDLCNKNFLQKCGEENHQKIHQQKNDPPKKTFTCVTCEMNFPNDLEKVKHVKTFEHCRRNLWSHFCQNSKKGENFTESDVIKFFPKLLQIHNAKDLTNFGEKYKHSTKDVLVKKFPNIERKYQKYIQKCNGNVA